MHGYSLLITLLTTPVITSSASFLSVSQPIIGSASTSLGSQSSGGNDNAVNTLGLDIADPIHEPGRDNTDGQYGYDMSDDDDDEYEDEDEDDDAWEEDFDLSLNGTTNRETSLNSTFPLSASARRVLLVKHIKCSGWWAGDNISGAVDALMDWGHEHLVGRNNVSQFEIGRSQGGLEISRVEELLST